VRHAAAPADARVVAGASGRAAVTQPRRTLGIDIARERSTRKVQRPEEKKLTMT
jgi:hypothetical protein